MYIALNRNNSLANLSRGMTSYDDVIPSYRKGKFNMDHVLNGSLAGGVAIGTTANMILHPFGALIIGSGAAILSVVGFSYIQVNTV